MVFHLPSRLSASVASQSIANKFLALVLEAPVLIVATLGALWTASRWVLHRWRKITIYERFIEDVATNHLPHIEHTLTLVCQKLNIEIGEAPPIRFMDFDERK